MTLPAQAMTNERFNDEFPSPQTRLSEVDCHRYREDGFLAFRNVLSAEAVAGARAAISELIAVARATRYGASTAPPVHREPHPA